MSSVYITCGKPLAGALLWLPLRDLQGVLQSGIRSLAVVLKHAAIFPDHEQAVGCLAREMGFTQVWRWSLQEHLTGAVHMRRNRADGCCGILGQVSLSSEVMQMVKMVPRGFTATADAYLTPHIMRQASCAALLDFWHYLLAACWQDHPGQDIDVAGASAQVH